MDAPRTDPEDAPPRAAPTVFTIGHSTHPIERFLALLAGHGVTALADVRSFPASRRHPQFDRAALAAALAAHGVAYVFLGHALGGRGRDRAGGPPSRAAFDGGIDRVLRGAAAHRVAIMCAEKEPLDCHRTRLVAPALRRRGARVLHIHADGALEDHDAALARLRAREKPAHPDLFGGAA